jgi:Tfp pilus assembly protein PilX
MMRYKIQNKKTDTCTILRSEKGMVLIVSLLLLLVATVIGITALSTSTSNVMISGSQRLSEINFAAADSAISVTIKEIEKKLAVGQKAGGS